MTLTERIEDSLSRGRLNYRQIKKVIALDEARKEASAQDNERMVEKCSSKIKAILQQSDLSAGERLSQNQKKHY